MKRYLYHIIVVLILAGSTTSYAFVDDFEDGNIDGWTPIQDPLSDGPYVGGVEISSTHVHAGAYSMRVFGNGGTNVIQRDNFLGDFGVYECWYYVDSVVGDGVMYYQYLDSENFFIVSCRPIASDNPEVKVEKLLNGDRQVIGIVPATFNLYEWFKLTVDRDSNGYTQIFINDELEMTFIDQSILGAGTFAVGSWVDTYVDDVRVDLDSTSTQSSSSWSDLKSLF